jgi:hypothetical protein
MVDLDDCTSVWKACMPHHQTRSRSGIELGLVAYPTPDRRYVPVLA